MENPGEGGEKILVNMIAEEQALGRSCTRKGSFLIAETCSYGGGGPFLRTYQDVVKRYTAH